MRHNEQLSPPRPSRGELFYIAERYGARTYGDGVQTTRVETMQPTGAYLSPYLCLAALGSIIAKPLGRYVEERHDRQVAERERAILAGELMCRDLDSFASIDELARYIVRNETPSRKH